MKIIYHDYPPNFNAIAKVLKVRHMPGVIFTYGDTVYIPNGQPMPPHLEAHEAVHIKQQAKAGPELWWDRYLTDTQFRLDQEVEAYQAQYQYLLDHYSRPERRMILKHIIKSLASGMYGHLVNREQAERLITGDQA